MNNKIYIADTYLHYDLQNELLIQNNHQPLVGIQIVDFYTYLETFAKNSMDSMRNTIEIYTRLQSVTNNLFEPLLENVSFIQEIQSINEELSKNKCSIHELPNKKQSQKSLYELLSVIQDIPTNGDYLKNVYTKLSRITDFSNITFVNFTYQNTWEQTIYTYMIEHGAQSIHTHIPTQKVEYHFALNKRLECESVAQRILELVNTGTPLSEIGIMVSDLTSYKDTLAFVMNRYNIPLYIPNNTKVIPVCDFLECLFNYYAKPNQTTFKNLISNTFFHTPHCESLFAYADSLHFNYEDYFSEFNYSSQLIGSPFLSKGNYETFIKYEKKAKIAQTHYTSFFNQIDSTTFTKLLDCLHAYLANNEERLQIEDIKLINKLYDTFYELSQKYPNQSISFFALAVAQWLKSTDQRFERLSNQITVCDLHTPPINKTHGFLLGMHQNGYPAFHNHSGLLNEELIALLPNFLSLSTRYENHMNLITKNLHFAKYLYISYPQSNYEGKINEHSLELEMEFDIKDPTIYPLQEGNHSYHRTYHLNPELAKELFVDNNVVYGSISRFEKYFNCPYQYFLNSGIRLKNLFSFKIKESELGTLQHTFLEKTVKAKGKEYPKASNEDIQQFLDDQFKNYETVFKKDSVTIDNLKQQIKLNLQNVLDNLNIIEQHTSFRPKEAEYRYDVNLVTYKDITLHIEGIIDRIDEIAQGIRIIDYKSSQKKFEKKKFQSGQMLQLITYAYMASMLLQKEVFGVYYYSMKPSTTKHIAGKVASRRYSKKLESYDIVPITQQDALDKKDINILYGNTFVTDTSSLLHLDDSAGEYISDIKKGNKDQIEAGILAKIQNPFTFEEAKEQLIIIYQYLIDQLLDGEINCTPTETACTYCEYSSICMYKGEKRKHAPMIIQDESEVK